MFVVWRLLPVEHCRACLLNVCCSSSVLSAAEPQTGNVAGFWAGVARLCSSPSLPPSLASFGAWCGCGKGAGKLEWLC
ncbi:hypothetical protein B0J12DRAFT_650106 [Macrophomina phaseolina]|uniref:Secreted protein n=1 Tax=Macrophomina phaseolina TaxID=35725 RepID=A0ABQ8GMS1_9PEZI|nr:hypothetical protein B0J12DRAFT_650106 [Macrophomina phaseolina]